MSGTTSSSTLKESKSAENYIPAEVRERAQEIQLGFDEGKPFLNCKDGAGPPTELKPYIWNQLSASEKEAYAISLAFCEFHAETYEVRTQKFHAALAQLAALNPTYQNWSIKTLQTMGVNGLQTHKNRQTAATVYHDFWHPYFLALAVCSAIDDPETRALAFAACCLHDIVQTDTKNTGNNEIQTAQLFYAERLKQLNDLIDKIRLDEKLNPAQKTAAIDAIEEYKKEIGFIANQTIVAATTMLKKMHGQLTISTSLLLYILTLQMPEKGTELHKLYGAGLAISSLDSSLPAFLRGLMADPMLSQALPTATYLPAANDEKTVYAQNQAALFYLQNLRMFAEIHELWGGALKQARFPYHGQEINGVEAWVKLLQACQDDNQAEINYLLTEVTSTHDVGEGDNRIPKGSTLVDFFIKKIQSEIDFANGQGLTQLKQLADKLDPESWIAKHIDDKAWQNHAVRLANLRDTYNKAANPTAKLAIAKQLVMQGSHPPALYGEKIIKNALADLEQKIENYNAQIVQATGKLNTIKADEQKPHPSQRLPKLNAAREKIRQTTLATLQEAQNNLTNAQAKKEFLSLIYENVSKKFTPRAFIQPDKQPVSPKFIH